MAGRRELRIDTRTGGPYPLPMASRLKNGAQAASLLVALAGVGLLVGPVFGAPVLHSIVPGWATMKVNTALALIVLTFAALIWFGARALGRAHRRIAHRERLYLLLSQCNQSIVHIAERDPLFARICQIAVELGKFRMAWIGLVDRETQAVLPVAHAGADDAFFERVKVSIRDEPTGRGPGGTAIREGRTVVSNDVHRDPRMAVWREDTLQRDFHSAAGFPIRNNGDIVGCFVLYAAEVDFFDAEEVKLLEEMATDISFALKQMERDAQRRRIEEEKNRLSAELQMILDSVPAMIFHKDRDHRLLRANAAMLRTLGRPPGELIGKTDAELGTPYYEQYARDEDEIAATGQPKLGFVEPLATPTGVRWLQTDKVPLCDDAGKITGFIGLAVDITERRLAEEALRASEADFRASFFSTAVGQVQADATTGRYLRVNPKFCEITGYAEEELLGMTFHELTHPEDREHDGEAHQDMVDGKIDELSREKRYRRKDGSAVWVGISASLIRDETGRPLRTLAVVRDITARHAAEDARHAAETKYRRLVEQSLVGIYLIQDDRFVYVNPTMAELFGCSADEMTARPLMDFICEEDRPMVGENVRMRIGGARDSIRYHLRMLRKDGAIIHVEAQGGRAEFDGRPAILGTLLDLTERKKIEAQLLQSHKMEAIGQLAGGIAHDFNNLLTAIAGNTKLALEDLPAGHSSGAYLAEIKKASGRAVDLVRRILTFSRQEPQERKIIQLEPVVEEALKLLRASLPAMLEIRTSYAAGAAVVLADATQIHQVVMNLGANASQAMGDGGVLEVCEVMIDIDADLARSSPDLRIGRYVRLSVSDSGCGMDRATIARIFDPFFTTKAQGEGTGLGLSVVHGIMKAHGGAITVYSEPGRGTTFHLYFPAAEGTAAEAQAPVRPVPRGQGERILYVDDEEPLVYLTTQVLGRLGYEVVGFVEAEAALSAFLAEPDRFDAVITDLSMPRLSGRDLAARFLKVRPDIPIILATGYIRPGDTEGARRMGIRDLILKPNTVEELGHTLHRILSERREAEVNSAGHPL
jgi:PAS domain S-box-containing protein